MERSSLTVSGVRFDRLWILLKRRVSVCRRSWLSGVTFVVIVVGVAFGWVLLGEDRSWPILFMKSSNIGGR